MCDVCDVCVCDVCEDVFIVPNKQRPQPKLKMKTPGSLKLYRTASVCDACVCVSVCLSVCVCVRVYVCSVCVACVCRACAV